MIVKEVNTCVNGIFSLIFDIKFLLKVIIILTVQEVCSQIWATLYDYPSLKVPFLTILMLTIIVIIILITIFDIMIKIAPLSAATV